VTQRSELKAITPDAPRAGCLRIAGGVTAVGDAPTAQAR
jgi:hypothetical protein